MPYGRRFGRRRSYGQRGQRRSAAGQGGMRAEFSGNQQIIRHSVQNTNPSGLTPFTLADGQAIAIPLLVYTGNSENSTARPDVSIQPTYAEGSRVNHIQTQMQITQEDATKPNGVYIGFISVAFSDAMLDLANMDTNFNNLIGVNSARTASTITTDGQFYDGELPELIPANMTMKDYLLNPQKRHWIRGLARNKFTLYSGRPIVNNQVLRVPLKNKRGQFGSGYWMVILNESGTIQGEEEGDGTNINVQINSFYKEIPLQDAPVTATP